MRDPLDPHPVPGVDSPRASSDDEASPRSSRSIRPVRYRAMVAEDLHFAVDQHLWYFPDGFFARLGSRFLHEYYRAFLTSRAARTTVAELDGERVGYLVGVTSPATHREHVVREHGRSLVLRAVLAMLVRPSLAVCFLRTRAWLYARKLLRRPHAGSSTPGRQRSSDATAVLTHVAVSGAAQGRGIGSALIEQFEQTAAAAGCDRLVLVTASGDDGAGPYYRRRGWKAVGERSTPDGLWLTTYERPVEAARG